MSYDIVFPIVRTADNHWVSRINAIRFTYGLNCFAARFVISMRACRALGHRSGARTTAD